MAIRLGCLNMLLQMAPLLLLASLLFLPLLSCTSILDLFAVLFLHLMYDKPDMSGVESNIMAGGNCYGMSLMTDMTAGSAARL